MLKLKGGSCQETTDGGNHMNYSINKLSKLAGVSIRTLHYYDEIELLSPKRTSSNDYRVYSPKEVALLQQILFYRELGIPLVEIKKLVNADNYDSILALQSHLQELRCKKAQIEALITTVEKTIAASKGEIIMSDKEKFEGFKNTMVEENEKKYGAEIRAKYGDSAINESNGKIKGMTQEQYTELEELTQQINSTLKAAYEEGNPAGELAQKVCELHKRWLGFYWNQYSKEAHLGLAQMYVEDPRFTKYYDENAAKGSAAFLLEAMKIYCS